METRQRPRMQQREIYAQREGCIAPDTRRSPGGEGVKASNREAPKAPRRESEFLRGYDYPRGGYVHAAKTSPESHGGADSDQENEGKAIHVESSVS